ncbi:MAG: amino acid permease [Bacteroidetes bacterium]|nr:amino acid permease [Bacteroidota bacterium]
MAKFETEVHLSREMRLLDVTMIGVGAMIGAGIFVLTGIAAGVAGPALIIAFALNGAVALLTAMSYAELGSCYHDAGGGYLWVKEGLPKWNGFLSGWMSWFAHAVACSLYALGFGAYFDHVLQEFGVSLPHWAFLSPQKLLAVGIAIIFAWINYRGASEAGKIGNLVTMSKILILAIFVGFGLEFILRSGNIVSHYTPFMPHGWGGVFKAMGLTFIAFQGFEVIAQCSEEVKNPRKNIPRAVFLSLIIVVPIYLLVAFVALGSVTPAGMTPWDYLAQQKETALVGVAESFFSGGGVLLLIGGLISTMSALNATVYSSSRVAFAMGRDRNFPTFFGKVHTKKFTPHYAIIFSFVIVALMAVSLPIEDVAAAADIMFLLLFLQVNIALIRLRRKRPDLDRGFITPMFPWLTIVGIALLLFLAVYMLAYSPTAWLVTAMWTAVGLGVYRLYASKREVAHIQHIEALGRLERKEYTILVPIANPHSVPSLMRIAIAIARKHNAEVLLLHVIEVEDRKPLRAGVVDSTHYLDVFETANDMLEAAGIPTRSIVKIAHRISQGVLETAVQEGANFILLGRQKNPKLLERIYSSILDSVIAEAPCEVAVLHGQISDRGAHDVLIPYGVNIHTSLALEIVPALLDQFSGTANVAAVFGPEIPTDTRSEHLLAIEEHLRESGLTARITAIEGEEVLAGLVRESRKADLMVMGGRSGDFFSLVFGQSLTQDITENVHCPVLWVKEYEEPVPFWKALITPPKKEVIHG